MRPFMLTQSQTHMHQPVSYNITFTITTTITVIISVTVTFTIAFTLITTQSTVHPYTSVLASSSRLTICYWYQSNQTDMLMI